MTREEAIEMFKEFSKEGDCIMCLGNYCSRIRSKFCEPCYILFPKLRRFPKPDSINESNLIERLLDCQCMCSFIPKRGNFDEAVKKAWRYINGEWG